MWSLKVNNTTVASNGSTSRPDPDGNCRPMAGSERHPEQTKWLESDNLWHFGISTTSTASSDILFLQIQQSNLLRYSDWFRKLLCYYNLCHYIPIDTASNYVPIPYDTTTYYAPILQSIQQAPPSPFLLIQQSHLSIYTDWYSKLLCQHPTTDTTILRYYTPIDTATILLLHLYWYNTLLRYYPAMIQQTTVTIYLSDTTI